MIWLLYPLGIGPPMPTEQEAMWTPKLVWMLWRRENKKYLVLVEK